MSSIVRAAGSPGTTVSVDGAPVARLDIDSAEVTPASIGAAPALAAGVRIYKTAQETITADGVEHELTFGSTAWNTGGYGIASTGVAVPSDGLYLCMASVWFGTGSAPIRDAILKVNYTHQAEMPMAVSATTCCLVSTLLALNADDFIHVWPFVGTGGATVPVSPGVRFTWLSVIRLGSTT